MNTLTKRVLALALILLSLPILLFVYQPSMQLGGFGILLGFLGMTVSPLILFVALFYFVKNLWKK